MRCMYRVRRTRTSSPGCTTPCRASSPPAGSDPGPALQQTSVAEGARGCGGPPGAPPTVGSSRPHQALQGGRPVGTCCCPRKLKHEGWLFINRSDRYQRNDPVDGSYLSHGALQVRQRVERIAHNLEGRARERHGRPAAPGGRGKLQLRVAPPAEHRRGDQRPGSGGRVLVSGSANFTGGASAFDCARLSVKWSSQIMVYYSCSKLFPGRSPGRCRNRHGDRTG